LLLGKPAELCYGWGCLAVDTPKIGRLDVLFGGTKENCAVEIQNESLVVSG